MITKNEEEWLMEEAIASQISNYLIKPVNPTQIFIACKNILEKVEIRNEHISKTFLSNYQTFNQAIENAENLEDWFKIHNDLCEWIVKFDKLDDINLIIYFKSSFKLRIKHLINLYQKNIKV